LKEEKLQTEQEMQREIRFLLQQVMRLQLSAPLPLPALGSDDKHNGSSLMESVVVLQSFNGDDSLLGSQEEQNLVLRDSTNRGQNISTSSEMSNSLAESNLANKNDEGRGM